MTLLVFLVAKNGEQEKVVFRRSIFLMGFKESSVIWQEFQRMVIYLVGWTKAVFLLILTEAAPDPARVATLGIHFHPECGITVPCEVLGNVNRPWLFSHLRFKMLCQNTSHALIHYGLIFCLIQNSTHLEVHARMGRSCTWAQVTLSLYFPCSYIPWGSFVTLRSSPYLFSAKKAK